MKKSIKKYIQVGVIIKTKNNFFYKVTKLFNHKFECKRIFDNEYWNGWEQEFYYNIDMEVYEMIATNYEGD